MNENISLIRIKTSDKSSRIAIFRAYQLIFDLQPASVAPSCLPSFTSPLSTAGIVKDAPILLCMLCNASTGDNEKGKENQKENETFQSATRHNGVKSSKVRQLTEVSRENYKQSVNNTNNLQRFSVKSASSLS